MEVSDILFSCIRSVLTNTPMQPDMQNTITSVLKAKNKLHGKTLILGISTALNTLITVLLVPKFGALGAAIGTSFSLVFGYGLALNLYYHFKIGINMKTYYQKTYHGILPAVLLSCIPGIILNLLLPTGGWLWFVVKALMYCGIYTIIIYFIGAQPDEKQYLQSLLRRKRCE